MSTTEKTCRIGFRVNIRVKFMLERLAITQKTDMTSVIERLIAKEGRRRFQEDCLAIQGTQEVATDG